MTAAAIPTPAPSSNGSDPSGPRLAGDAAVDAFLKTVIAKAECAAECAGAAREAAREAREDIAHLRLRLRALDEGQHALAATMEALAVDVRGALTGASAAHRATLLSVGELTEQTGRVLAELGSVAATATRNAQRLDALERDVEVTGQQNVAAVVERAAQLEAEAHAEATAAKARRAEERAVKRAQRVDLLKTVLKIAGSIAALAASAWLAKGC